MASALLVVACDSDPYQEEPVELEARSLVGVVEGTDVALGALLDGDTLAVYQCGGDQTFETHTRWFRGTIGNDDGPNAFEVVSEDFTLVGTRTEDGLDGDLIEPDGTRHAFHVDPVADDSDAGVYVAEHEGRSAGVVVREEGGELIAQGASCSASPRLCDQVIILAPLAVESDRLDVQLDIDGMRIDLEAQRTFVAPEGS